MDLLCEQTVLELAYICSVNEMGLCSRCLPPLKQETELMAGCYNRPFFTLIYYNFILYTLYFKAAITSYCRGMQKAKNGAFQCQGGVLTVNR